MAEPINIGLDFGSLGWRAAYVVGEETVFIPTSTGWDDPLRWLVCERSPASELSVHFPSIKSLLGMESAEDAKPAVATVQVMLTELRRLVEEQTQRPPGQLVIAVPALYSTTRRTALHDLALAAGFADVHLLNDSVAAVIGHTRQREGSLTALVYSMGYSGFEVGLIRLAKGRYRAIAYDGAPSPGGAAFDQLIMRGCLYALAKARLWSPAHDMTKDGWLGLRLTAQSLKERLSIEDIVSLKLVITVNGIQQVMLLAIPRIAFEQAIADAMAPSLDASERLIEDANLSATDVNEILLAGGSTQIGVVRRLISKRFGREPVLCAGNLIAQGAAVYASRLGLVPTTETALVRRDGSEAVQETASTIPVVNITLSSEDLEGSLKSDPAQEKETGSPELQPTSAAVLNLDLTVAKPTSAKPSPSAEKDSNSILETVLTDREHLLHYARQLIEQGSYSGAEGFLQGLIDDAQALLASIPSWYKPKMKIEVEKALKRGYELLKEDRYQHAVDHAHYAYGLDPENPEVFRQMIDIHCQAAMALTSIEGYKKSMQWLMCAHSHDRTNSEIHDRIAERHFIHAQQAIEQDRPVEALKALVECLYFNPEHGEAMALNAAVAQRLSQ